MTRTPSPAIAGNQRRYSPAPMATSPGWWPGVVLPRLTPGRKRTGPCAVDSAKPSAPARASVRRPARVSGRGAHEGPAGADGPAVSSTVAAGSPVVPPGEQAPKAIQATTATATLTQDRGTSSP